MPKRLHWTHQTNAFAIDNLPLLVFHIRVLGATMFKVWVLMGAPKKVGKCYRKESPTLLQFSIYVLMLYIMTDLCSDPAHWFRRYAGLVSHPWGLPGNSNAPRVTGSLWCRCAALTRLGEANALLYHQLFDGQGAKEPGVTIHIPDSMGS
jgi:hypothetical protein